MTSLCLQLLHDSEGFLDHLGNWELVAWCLALGFYLLRFMTIGNKINNIQIQSMRELERTLKHEKAKIALLAVPAIHAQLVADRLVDAGIQAILNYAPINLEVPDHVNVEYSDPVVQLQHMTYYIDED